MIIVILSGFSYIFLRKKNYLKFMFSIIGIAIIIPASAYALCSYDLIINSNIKLLPKEKSVKIYLTYFYKLKG